MERRRQIVSCARDLFEKQGLAKTSVRSITDQIGVTRTLFYHYFADKDELVGAVLDDYVAEFVEELRAWNEQRKEGDVEGSLDGLVDLLRNIVLENGTFRRALASHENAALYIAFVNRVAERMSSELVGTTMMDYGRHHTIEIDHVYETVYVLIIGITGYIRSHPDVGNDVLKDVIAQALHIERG